MNSPDARKGHREKNRISVPLTALFIMNAVLANAQISQDGTM
jgi:hypothetical protein